MRNHFLRANGVPSSGNTFNGVTTNLEVHYDFSRTDCWNRNQSTNAADYTVNNLAKDYADALFRDRSTGAFEHGSASSCWSFNSSEGGGCLQTVPSNHTDNVNDDAALVIPGASTSTSDDSFLHDMPTVSSTSSQNLMNGIGTGAFTIEMWVQFYVNHSNSGAARKNFFIKGVHAGTSIESYHSFRFYDANYSVSVLRGDLRWLERNGTSGNHSARAFVETLPGAPGSGAGWSDWLHIVFSRESGSSDNVKLYCNNSLETTETNTNNWDYNSYVKVLEVENSIDPPRRHGIFRFYKGKALTSSEVTTNWNAQKSRFGH